MANKCEKCGTDLDEAKVAHAVMNGEEVEWFCSKCAPNRTKNERPTSKRAKSKFKKLPKNMNETKKLCRKICNGFALDITYDDEYGNFNGAYNQCANCGEYVECSKFSPWNYDLLLFAVMHEIGHHVCDKAYGEKYHVFSRECKAWDYAMEMYTGTFGQNISIKMARYMMKCLESYIPDYNDYAENTESALKEQESSFFCPMTKRVIRRNNCK